MQQAQAGQGPPRTLVAIPAFNEEATIAEVLARVKRAAPACDRVVIDDGSRDGTASIVERLGERRVSLPCNLGYGGAIQTALKYALLGGYEVVVLIDSDGQHDPADIPRLVAELDKSGADMAIGSRFCAGAGRSESLTRSLGQRLFSQLTGVILGDRIYDTTSGFKAIRRRAALALVGPTFNDFHTEAIVRLGLLRFRIAEVPIEVAERHHGQSMYSFVSALEYPLKTLLLTLVAAIDALLLRRAR